MCWLVDNPKRPGGQKLYYMNLLIPIAQMCQLNPRLCADEDDTSYNQASQKHI